MIIAGIDLGTTHSLIGIIKNGKPLLFKGDDGSALVPSVVYFDSGGTVEVGSVAKAKKTTAPDKTLYSVKRFMGRSIGDVTDWTQILPFDFSGSDERSIRLTVDGKSYTPIEISALILKKLRSLAQRDLSEVISKVVITTPAYFDDTQRQATKLAGELAGLEIIRIINEPTAACLAYGLDKKAKGNIAVFDLGGGTFDISILKTRDGIFEVLATNGDTALGGDDFDNAIAQRISEEIRTQTSYPVDSPQLKAQILAETERLKRKLSDQEHDDFKISFGGSTFKRPVSREELERWIVPILHRSKLPCETCIQDSGLGMDALSDVILVGGSTKIPLVKRYVKELFGREPICSLNPEEVVAMGACVQANVLAGQMSDVLLLDVIPLSLGIETMGGIVSKIIHRNTTIPVSASELFTTYMDNQTGVDIHILQGERELVQDNRSLGRFKLQGLPAMPAGLPKVEVEFVVDANGILSVRATELRTQQIASIQINPTYGLTDSEVERMLRESMEQAESDFERRFLIEARTDASGMLRSTRRSLEKGTQLISLSEREQIESLISELETAIQGTDHRLIREKMNQLAVASKHLAEELLKEALSSALRPEGVTP